MFRQTALGIALSTLVLASGFTTTISGTGHTFSKKSTQYEPFSIPSSRVRPSSTAVKSTDLEKSVFEQINRYRLSRGLPKLYLSTNISQQARIHSLNMARGKVPFSHRGFRQRVTSTHMRFRSAGENVAFNLGYNDPANQAVIGWIDSPGHLANIKGNYNLTGIGVATNSKGEVYLTQIFLRNR